MSENAVDNELVSQVLKGDKEAFNVLVLKYQKKIHQLATRYADDSSTAMDITQETFLKAYRSLDKFRADSTFYTWIYRIAINTAKNFGKVKIRRPPDTDIDYIDAEVLPGRVKLKETETPERLLIRDEVQEALLLAVNNLPDDLRVAMVLREMAGLSYDDIALVMKCPVGTVRSRIFRARETIDENLKPYM